MVVAVGIIGLTVVGAVVAAVALVGVYLDERRADRRRRRLPVRRRR